MDILNKWNDVVVYIEEHLDSDVDIETMSKIVAISSFHFQRMFSYMTNMTLYDYIRRRKMTKAAVDLQNPDNKIIDIALKYGYESPTAFNRAFQSMHGIAPSKARAKGVILKAYPPIIFSLSIKGESEMNYRIEEKEAFKIVGIKKQFGENALRDIPLFWDEAKKANIIKKELCPLLNTKIMGALGVCAPIDSKRFDYYIAVATTSKTPKGLSELIVPKSKWAIFEVIGPMSKAVQDMTKRIMTEWLPSSGYESLNLPDIELYFDEDENAHNHSEIWIPIKAK